MEKWLSHCLEFADIWADDCKRLVQAGSLAKFCLQSQSERRTGKGVMGGQGVTYVEKPLKDGWFSNAIHPEECCS